MSIWALLLVIGGAGAVGGLINAFLENDGLLLWRKEILSDGAAILRPGFIGNVVVGAVTAVVLAGLYGPLGAMTLSSSQSIGGACLSHDHVFASYPMSLYAV